MTNSIGKSGGVKAIFEFANGLARKGHDVEVVYPLWPLRDDNWNKPLWKALPVRFAVMGKQLISGVKAGWFNLDARVKLRRVLSLASVEKMKCDVAVATWWETAYFVSMMRDCRRFYLVQHYETWGGDEAEVKGSYRLGLDMIVHSTWMQETIEKNIGIRPRHLIYHSPDHSKFYPETVKRSLFDSFRILVPYRGQDWKGSKDGIKAFELVKKQHPNVQLVMFGMTKGEDVPAYAEFHLNPSDDELRILYNSSDVFLFPSWHEGFGMPPLEAMACGTPVVATRVGVFCKDFLDGVEVLLSDPYDVQGLADNVSCLFEDDALRLEIAKNGRERVLKDFTWDNAVEEMEKAIK